MSLTFVVNKTTKDLDSGCTLSEAKRNDTAQNSVRGRSEVRILENATHISNIKIIIIKASSEFGWTGYRR